jgi:hypothetical protein
MNAWTRKEAIQNNTLTYTCCKNNRKKFNVKISTTGKKSEGVGYKKP